MSLTPDRRALLLSPLATALLCAAPSHARTLPMTKGSIHDFDFLIGAWKVRHRRLKGRLVGATEWMEFDGTCVMRTLMGGAGNVEDNFLDLPGEPYRAVGLRAFDPKTGAWSIWWLDSRYLQNLDPPVVGGFENGVGTFLADDVHDGKPIKVRFQWSDITTKSAIWRQAYSPDAGATWETNWEMRFTRTA